MDFLSQWCKEDDLSDGKMSYLFYCSMWTCCKLTIGNFLIAIQTSFHMGIGCIFSFNYWILFHLRFWKELCLRPTNGGEEICHPCHTVEGVWILRSFKPRWFARHKTVLEVGRVFEMLPEWNSNSICQCKLQMICAAQKSIFTTQDCIGKCESEKQ